MAAAPAPQVLLNALGQLDPFDPSDGETFSQWYSRFNLYCATNLVPQEPVDAEGNVLAAPNRRRTFFLTAIGKRAFSVLYTAALPADPVSFAVDDLAGVLRMHYENPGLTEANRMKFHQRVQRADETVFSYIGALQELAVSCNFGEFFDQALRGQLICGIRHADTKAKLLSNPNLTFDEAKVTAMQDDTVRIQIKAMAQAHASAQASVNAVSTRPNPRNSRRGRRRQRGGPKPTPDASGFAPCHRCTRRHDVAQCPAKDWECFSCGKKGHTSSACFAKPKEQQSASRPRQQQGRHHSQGNRSNHQASHHLQAANPNESADTIAERLLDIGM